MRERSGEDGRSGFRRLGPGELRDLPNRRQLLARQPDGVGDLARLEQPEPIQLGRRYTCISQWILSIHKWRRAAAATWGTR